MTYNTGNPLGSSDPRDLIDNAESLDRALNDSAPTFTDRLGNSRHTLAGLETLATGVPAVEASIAAVAAWYSAVSAKASAEAARDAALIQSGVYADEPTGRAAVSDGDAFKVQGAGEVAAYEYRRVNSSSSTLIATYPSAGYVSNQAIFAGYDADAIISTTAGSADSPPVNFTLLGSPIAATRFPFPENLFLDSVSFNVASAGSGEIHVYAPTTSGTTWTCTHVQAVTFDSAGKKTVQIGGIEFVKGSIIAYRPISGYLNAQSTGRFYVLEGYTGVGSTVTFGITNTNDPALSYVGRYVNGGTLNSRAGALEASVGGVVQDTTDVKTFVGKLIAQGDTSYTLTQLSAPNSTVVGSSPIAYDGELKEVSIRTGSAGSGEIRIYEPTTSTSWTCTHVLPVTFAAGGVNTFSVANGKLPAGVTVKSGGYVGYRMITGVLCNAPFGTGMFHIMNNDAGGVGGVNVFSFSNTLEPAIAFKVDRSASDATISGLSSFINTRFALVPGTRAYSLGDSTIAATGYTEIINLVGTVREKINVAVGGDTFAGQKAKWQALSINPNLVGWVIIQLGLNDLVPSEAASVAIARLQDLVNSVRASIGYDRPLLIGKMLPCKQRLIDIYGATAGPIAQQKWVDINEAIAGNGATPITGVNGRITSHVPALDDGNGNLKAEYDSGDHIHENLAGRQIIADAWVKAMIANCIVC